MTEKTETNEEMIIRFQSSGGGPKAAEIMTELWERNIRYVRLAVHQLTGLSYSDTDFEDMVQQAYFGFRAAVYTYDPVKYIQFITYAGKRIKWELCRYYEQNGLAVRIPAYMKKRLRDGAKMKMQLETETGHPVSFEAALKALDLSPVSIAGTLETMKKLETISLDSFIAGDTDGATYLDLLVSAEDVADDVVEQEWVKDLRMLLFSALQEIPEDAREIIVLHYFHGISFSQMARELDITRQTIWNKQNDAFRLMRTGKHGQALVEFMPSTPSFERAQRLIKQDRGALERLQLNDTERSLLVL